MSFWRADIDPDQEPHRVMIERAELVDHDRRGRVVPIKVYYPANHQMTKLPVIVWSHGLGGSRDGAAFLARFMASYGYVVVNIQHKGTDSGLWEGKPGHPWDNIRAAHILWRDIRDRYADVPFVLDCLKGWGAVNEEVGLHMDLTRMGMSGHSLGANTTQIMAGQLFGRDTLRSHYEARFKAAIAYSPLPTHCKLAPEKDVYGAINMPLFHMTGTADESPVEFYDYTKRLEVYKQSGGPEQHKLVLEGGDHMVFVGSRGKLDANPKRKAHEAIIKIASLAFWDAYLKDDRAAHEWLTGPSMIVWLGGDAVYGYRK